MIEKLLSVIIIAYRSADYISDCISSIFRYNDIGEALEVIVVDNSPAGDPTGDVIKTRHPEVIYIPNPGNSGFGAGNNLGVSRSKGRNFLFLNPDTILIEPIFRWAADIFEKNPQTGIFGVRLVDRQFKPVQSFSYLPDQYNLFNVFFHVNEWRNVLNLPPRRRLTVGADLFVRRDFLEGSGGFDENLFLYFEECDLYYRAVLRGYRTEYYPDKKIIHLEGQSSSHMSGAKYKYYFRSLQYIIEKHRAAFPNLKNKLELMRKVMRWKHILTKQMKFKQLEEDLGALANSPQS